MRDPRVWSVILAGTWFLTGFGAGHLVSARTGEPAAPHARYAEELCRTFDLDGLRRSALLDLLDQAEIERESVRRRHEARSFEAMEPDLREIDEEVEFLIRNKVIPPSRRAEFDRLALPTPVASAPQPHSAPPSDSSGSSGSPGGQ